MNSRRLCIVLAIFCIYANVFGILLSSTVPVYVRDAILLSALLIGLFRRGALYVIIPLLLSSIVFVVSVLNEGGIAFAVLPKLRNYLMFPFLVGALKLSFAELGRLSAPRSRSSCDWIIPVYYSIAILILVESLVYILFPEIQGLLYLALTEFSDAKGVSVGLGGGVINSGRAMTPLLSPVQGSLVLFLGWLFMPKSKLKDVSLVFAHVATFSKITFAAYAIAKLKNQTRASKFLCAALASLLLAASVLFLPGDVLEINSASSGLHFEGATSGLYSVVAHPFGLPLDKVGAVTTNEDGVRPGFESFLGSFVAAFGVIGWLVLACLYFWAAASDFYVALFFLLWLFSDNVSSPHLFTIPIFFLLISRSVSRNGAASAEYVDKLGKICAGRTRFVN